MKEGEEYDPEEEISFYRQHTQKLEAQTRKIESEKSKQPSLKTKLLKKLRVEVSAVRRKLRNYGVDIIEHPEKEPDPEPLSEPSSSTGTPNNIPPINSVDSGRETETEALDTNGHAVPHLNGGSNLNMSPSSSSGIGIAQDEETLPVNGANGPEISEKSFEEIPGPKIEENGNIPNGTANGDDDGTEDPTDELKNELKENEYLPIKKKDPVVTNGHDDLQNFQPLDLVWAKCKGYPWYPALIMNPELATQEPLLHGDEELPQPNDDVIQMGNQYNDIADGEVHHLVLFFDQRRTW